MKTDLVYLDSMLESVERIEKYTQAGKEAFMTSTLTQDAVIRNLEILGEATKRLSMELRQEYAEVPWKKIAGLRDVLIHDYLQVRPDRIWQVIVENIPILKTTLITIIRELD